MNTTAQRYMRKKWYDTTFIQFEIVKQLKDRAIMLKRLDKPEINNFPLIIYNIQTLQKVIDYYEFTTVDWQFFMSPYLVKFGVMNHPHDRREIKTFRETEFIPHVWDENTKELRESVYGYDLIVDIDNNNLQQSLKHAKQVYDLFKSYDLPFVINFSGKKGFHLRTPWQYLEKPALQVFGDKNNFYKSLKGIVDKIHLKFSIETDTQANVYKYTSMIRCLYTVHPETNLICLPLSDEQLDTWLRAPDARIYAEEFCSIGALFKGSAGKLMNRGDLCRTGSQGGVLRFLQDFKPDISSEPTKEQQLETQLRYIRDFKPNTAVSNYEQIMKAEVEAIMKEEGVRILKPEQVKELLRLLKQGIIL